MIMAVMMMVMVMTMMVMPVESVGGLTVVNLVEVPVMIMVYIIRIINNMV